MQAPQASPLGLVSVTRFGDATALDSVRRTAEDLRRNNHHFAAGFLMEHAIKLAWGSPPEMRACGLAALEDFRHVYEGPDPHSLGALLALFLAAQIYLSREYVFLDTSGDAPRAAANQLLGEMTQRLFTRFRASPEHDHYLVRGVMVRTDLLDAFTAQFVEHEVKWGYSAFGPEFAELPIPSAFTLALQLVDYSLAHQIAELCPDAFTAPGLRGWRAAVRGLLDPALAPESFAEAADAFAQDTCPQTPEERARYGDGPWDNMNTGVWAPHFRVRSCLAAAVRNPARLRECIASAARAADPEAGSRGAPSVRRMASLAQALDALLRDESAVNVTAIEENFALAGSMDGQNDPNALLFVRRATEALRGFRDHPTDEMITGRLGVALEALRRVSFLEPGLSDVVAPAIRQQAVDLFTGPLRTWIHRTLEALTAEASLQHIILRLSQASLPLRAQVLQGPLEYGKDVIALFRRDGELVLRMYQAKIGDMSLGVWRDARPQLEEMFQVPLPVFIVPVNPPPRREGVLIFNGHENPYSFPAVQGWLDEQKATHGRSIELMNIDGIVRWITDARLESDFRRALEDLGLKPVQ